MKYHLMAKPNWPGIFRRAGIEFAPQVPCALDRGDFLAVIEDVGASLCLIKFDDKGRPRPDWDRTAALRAAVEIIRVGVLTLPREKRPAEVERGLDKLLDEFFAPPPVVEETHGEESGEAIALEESLIPKQFHKPLLAANLHDLDAIGIYLQEHGDLTGIPGIGEPSAKAIMEALEQHRQPEAV